MEQEWTPVSESAPYTAKSRFMCDKRLIIGLVAGFLASTPGLLAAQQTQAAAPSVSQEGEGDGETTDETPTGGIAETTESADEEAEEADPGSTDQNAQQALATGGPLLSQDKAWTISASLGTRVGQGTFANLTNDTLDNGNLSSTGNRATLSANLSPSYTLGNFVGSASMGVTQNLTRGGDPNGPYRTRISDLSFDVFWYGKTFEKTRTNISTDIGFSLPTSKFSRATSMWADTFLSVILRQPLIGRMFFVGSVTGGKTFHRYTSPVANLYEIDDSNVLFRANGAENLGDGLVAIDGRNTEYGLYTSAGFNFIVLPKMTASIRYRYSRFWSYKGEIPEDCATDPLCSPNAQGGRGVGDQSAGSIGVNYQLSPNFFLNGSLSSNQSPKTADNRSFRFPFWNFEGAAANNSAVSVGLSFVY